MEDDIVYGFVLDEDGRELAHTFAGGVPAELKGAHPVDPLQNSSSLELSTDRGPVLDVAVPLLRGQIGVLHLGLSETAIRKEVNEILMLIVTFAAGTLLIGSAVAIVLARVITRPLLKLAGAAEAFGREGASRPVAIDSEDEVGQLARVFNAMIESRGRIEGERERLIEELRKTLSEVKTLRGFLPICSSCKKIRIDQGSWQQIEILHQGPLGCRVQPRHLPGVRQNALPGVLGQNQGTSRVRSPARGPVRMSKNPRAGVVPVEAFSHNEFPEIREDRQTSM